MMPMWLAGSLPYRPTISVTATTTLGSGGTADWWGRPYTVRRPSDNALVMIYRRGTAHDSMSSTALHIKFSDDDGATWTAEDTDLDGNAVTGFPLNPTAGNVSFGEGMPMVAPNGDLVILMWNVDGSASSGTPHGTWQARSTDGGSSWTQEGQLDIGGGLTQDRVFLTDDWVTVDGVTYTGGRVYNAVPITDSYVIWVKNETSDLAVGSWEYVADITSAGSDTQEIGITYVRSRWVGWIRSLNNNITRKATSTDGLTWTVTTVSSTPIGISGRHRVRTIASLLGEANPQDDPRLLIEGFLLGNPGSSQTRTNAVWFSPDAGDTVYGPFPLDTQSEDGGYGDVFGKADGTFGVVSYQGTLNAASLKQYDFALTGT